jgi:hypothetical protein
VKNDKKEKKDMFFKKSIYFFYENAKYEIIMNKKLIFFMFME